MHFLVIIFAMFLSTVSHAANLYDLRVIRVVDGDTVTIDAPFLPVELRQTLNLRIHGVDTPEKGSLARCDFERQRGELATRFTQRVVASARRHQVVLFGWDKYGGRVLGDLILDGQSLRQLLIINGYAREYNGGRRSSWCN